MFYLFSVLYFCHKLLFPLTLQHSPVLNQELSDIFNELWRLDVNRWTPGIDYIISIQVKTSFLTFSIEICFHNGISLWNQGRAGYVSQGSHVVQDHASLPLFSNVTEAKLLNTTTLSRKSVTCNNFNHLICIYFCLLKSYSVSRLHQTSR